MKRSLIALMAVAAYFMFACGGENTITDAGTDASIDGGADAGNIDLSEPLGPGQVRAGVITKEAELIGGPMSRGRVGDIKLYNSKIRVVIEGIRGSDGWGTYGGTVADADVVRPAGTEGESVFGEYFFGFGLMTQDPATVQVINNGLDGKAAVVRFVGPDKVVPFMDVAFKEIFHPTPLNTTITVDYILPPDSEVMEIQSSFTWTRADLTSLEYIMQAFMMGDGVMPYRSGPGFDASGFSGDTDIFLMAGRNVSYGFFALEAPISQMIRYQGINLYTQEPQNVRKGKTYKFTRYMSVTGGGADGAYRILNSMKEISALGHVTGKVTDAAGKAVAGARVHVMGTDSENLGHIDLAIAGADGSYSAELAPGNYKLIPYQDQYPLAAGEAVAVAAGGTQTKDLALPAPGTITYRVKNAGGAFLPSKIFFDRKEGAVVPPVSFGELVWGGGHQWVVNAAPAEGSVSLPAGAYKVTATHGFEYTIASSEIAVAAGSQQVFEAQLSHVVDTAGFVSSDFHLHSMNSPDSDVYFEDLVASFGALGIDAPISTDHDYISDWYPTAQKLGLTSWTRPIIGDEITTYVYGHFNAWPLVQEPEKVNMGAFDWYYKLAPQLFPEVVNSPTHPLLILNHPRAISIGGYLSAVGYNRDTGTVLYPDNWSEDFDTIELINGGDIGTAVSQTIPDWYSFLNRGKRKVGTSGSDLHSITGMAGNVRNYMASSTDDPALVDPDELAANVRAMKVLVTTGPYINVSIGDKGMGDLAGAVSGKAYLTVKVQGPEWMDINRLTVVANGQVVETIKLDESTRDPGNPVVRINRTLEYTPSQDVWYVVYAEGDSSTPPVTGPRPYAFTNPIFVDADGNGRFDPPIK